MNAKLFFVALLMFYVCVFAIHGEEEIENLLINPSIEGVEEEHVQWRGGNPGREDNLAWHVRGTDKGLSKATLDDKDFIDGEQSLSATRKKAGWVGIEQGYWTGAKEIVLEPDTKYTLAAWMKTSVPGDVKIKLGSWEAPFPNWGEEVAPVKTHWAEYHVTATAKDLTTQVWFEFRFGDDLQDLLFDFAHLYVGDYVASQPSEIPQAVASKDKLAVTWGKIRRAQ